MGLWYMSYLLNNVCKLSTISTVNYARRLNSTIRKIDKLLVANRGEIACRVMRTARRLGVQTVAVYSDVDKNSMHVALADEAYHIGQAPAQESYLRGDKIINVAKSCGCQAIHPGYGFLSENAEFADACQHHGVIFVGPPASAIRDMGIKSTSKEIMSKAGVPIIQGYHGKDQTDAKLKSEALKIGFPIMIKAVRGGGGKGMRIALSESEFDEALESARRESLKAFGDSDVLLENFVQEPRHVEVQVFADTHGNAVYLFERDCSVQRRHQKIIEEAPAPDVTEELRAELGLAAVRAAKAVGYVGAGTVEFIMDRKTKSFHFMEMNTRLQVEHPVTEMISGVDLVEWQLKVASGEALPMTQDDLKLNGHSFEARIYAENPRGGFLPGAGPLFYLRPPQPSDDVRVETGVKEGDQVSVYYDPMIAKLVVWGKNRPEALTKLEAKLTEYHIAGLETNVNFLLDLCRHPEFQAGNVHTNFIKDHHDSLFKPEKPTENQLIQAAMAIILKDNETVVNSLADRNDKYNPFVVESGFRINYDHFRNIKLKMNEEQDFAVKVKFLSTPGEYEATADGGKTWRKVTARLDKNENKESLKCTIDDAVQTSGVFNNGEFIAVFDKNGKQQYVLEQSNFSAEEAGFEGGNADRAVAPMPGVLDKILVKPGDLVRKGDSLVIIIAMKMEYIVKAARDGKIQDILHKVGENVAKDTVLVKFEELSE